MGANLLRVKLKKQFALFHLGMQAGQPQRFERATWGGIVVHMWSHPALARDGGQRREADVARMFPPWRGARGDGHAVAPAGALGWGGEASAAAVFNGAW